MTTKKKLRRRIRALEDALDAARLHEDLARLKDVDTTTLPTIDEFDVPTVVSPPLTVDFTVRCTCPPNRAALVHDNYRGSCPIHDVYVTYTTTPWVRA